MICYFWKGLKPSIKIEIEQQNRALISFKEMVQRAVNVKTKAGLRSSIMVRNINSHYSRDYHSSQNTSIKIQTQNLTIKESKPKKSRPKEIKLANSRSFILSHSNKAIKLNC